MLKKLSSRPNESMRRVRSIAIGSRPDIKVRPKVQIKSKTWNDVTEIYLAIRERKLIAVLLLAGLKPGSQKNGFYSL